MFGNINISIYQIVSIVYTVQHQLVKKIQDNFYRKCIIPVDTSLDGIYIIPVDTSLDGNHFLGNDFINHLNK